MAPRPEDVRPLPQSIFYCEKRGATPAEPPPFSPNPEIVGGWVGKRMRRKFPPLRDLREARLAGDA